MTADPLAPRSPDRLLADRLLLSLLAVGLLAALTLAWLLLRPSPVAPPADPLAARLAAAGATLDLPAPAALIAEGPTGADFAVGDDRVRLRVTLGLPPGEATPRADQEHARLLALYVDHQLPYPGELSHTLQCPERLLPADLPDPGPAHHLLRAWANDRLTFGGCAEDLLRYVATVAAFVSPDGTRLVRVEWFEPKATAAPRGPDVLRSFRWL